MQWALGKGHFRKGFVSYAKELGFKSRGLEMRKGEKLASFQESNYVIIFAFLEKVTKIPTYLIVNGVWRNDH